MGHVSVHFAGAAGEEQDVAGQEEEQEVAGQEEQYEDLFQEAASYEEEEQERGRRRERRVSRRVASQSRSEERRRSLSEESSRSRRSRRSRSRDSRSRSRGRTRPRRAGHEHHRLTHRQNRLQTCVLCWRQGGRKGSKAIAIRPVTSKLAATLRALTHHKDYSEECTSHPAGICNTDLKKLLDLQKVAEGRSGYRRLRGTRTCTRSRSCSRRSRSCSRRSRREGGRGAREGGREVEEAAGAEA